MDVDDPGKRSPFLISVEEFSPEDRRTAMWTYVAAKKAAIISKISASLPKVSSNPGVSMRVTTLPPRVNSSAIWTSAVHDPQPVPTRKFEPLARFMNFG